MCRIAVGQSAYYLNVCGNLASYSCGNNTNAAACQQFPAKNVTLGYPNSSLVLTDGQVTLSYLGGDACYRNGPNRSVIITFICDPTVSGKGGPTFVSQTSNCTFLFNWHTDLVCSQTNQLSCIVDAPSSNVYMDLTPLRRSSSNWILSDPTSGSTFALNLCQNLVQDTVCTE